MKFITLITAVQLSGLASSLPLAPRDDTWDVIVVGSGPAGIIVADRLSEAGKKTLLLESGGPSYYVTGGRDQPAWLEGFELSRVDVPGLYKSIFDASTNPDNLLCGSQVNAYLGCTVGGNSAINAGLFFQPPASDFDTYFPDGWHSSDVQSAIANLNQRQPSSDITSQNNMLYLQSGYDAARDWIVNGAGYSEVDINADADNKDKVFGHPIFDYDNGQRGGPAITYLQTALQRDNFQMQTGAKVNRVLRNGDTATGVSANVSGQDTTFNLNNGGRVILSAGALQSPQLLMLSGIGDPEVIQRISDAGKLPEMTAEDWINNTAVGVGLFDNPNTFIELSSPDVSSYTYSYSSPIQSDADEYVNSRDGPYSFASETSVFWATTTHDDGSVAALQGTIDSAGYSDYTNNNTITLNVYGTSGLKSSGKVTLDDNFVATPSGDVYYSDADGQDATDIATFIRGLFDVLGASSLTPLNISPSASIDDIKSYITTSSAYARGETNHWSSSCTLGKGCVDTQTRVVGMQNLHVVDGSIVPPLTVNPQMGIMIAAEKASEIILSL